MPDDVISEIIVVLAENYDEEPALSHAVAVLKATGVQVRQVDRDNAVVKGSVEAAKPVLQLRIAFAGAVVTSSSDGLVFASPRGPCEGSLFVRHPWPGDLDQQSPDFRFGQRDQFCRVFERAGFDSDAWRRTAVRNAKASRLKVM